MKSHFVRGIPIRVVAALAVLVFGCLVALGVRSLAGTASADPAVPNPGHSYDQIELPVGTWAGMDADKLDAMHAGQSGTNYVPYADASGRVGIGTTSPQATLHVWGEVDVRAGVSLDTGETQPTCSSTTRGMLWFKHGGTGVADTLEVCARDASAAYAWRLIW